MTEAKIRLSQKEMELITNADWILTKNTILKKIDQFLSGLQVDQKELLSHFDNSLPVEILHSSPKISKGENYQGLPYRMLDYPKVFTQTDIFAIRTMFWWGNWFSITVHLSGVYKKKYQQKIIEAYSNLKNNKIYYCINENQWEHHFEDSNYVLIENSDQKHFESTIAENSFCKLACLVKLQELTTIETSLLVNFKKMIELFADQAPKR